MDEKQQQEKVRELIIKDFELAQIGEGISEDELFKILVDQVGYMIEYKLDVLLSLMYRLDIEESKVHFALSPFAPEPANIGIARLVLERQKKRAFTKLYYKQSPLGNLDDLEF